MLKLERLASHCTSAASKPAWLPPSTRYCCILSVITVLSLADAGGLSLACPSRRDERSQSCAGSRQSPAARCSKTCVRWPALKTQPCRRAGAARGRGRDQEHWEATPGGAQQHPLFSREVGDTTCSQVMRYIKHVVSASSHLVNTLH